VATAHERAARPRTSAEQLASFIRATRIALSGALIGLFYVDHAWSRWVALTVVCLIWASDILDGRVVRRSPHAMRMTGVVFDPIADDVAYAAGFLYLLASGMVPLWFVALVVAGRATVALVRLITLAEGLQYAGPSRANRVKGASYASGQIVLFAAAALGDSAPFLQDRLLRDGLVAVMTVLTMVAIVDFTVVRHREAVARLFRR
jgi:phosphatidylglycerophosphate synthase